MRNIWHSSKSDDTAEFWKLKIDEIVYRCYLCAIRGTSGPLVTLECVDMGGGGNSAAFEMLRGKGISSEWRCSNNRLMPTSRAPHSVGDG